MPNSQHVYEVRPRKDKRGVDLISDALPFRRLWYGDAECCRQRSWICAILQPNRMSAVIRVYDEAGNVIETHEHKGDFKEW